LLPHTVLFLELPQNPKHRDKRMEVNTKKKKVHPSWNSILEVLEIKWSEYTQEPANSCPTSGVLEPDIQPKEFPRIVNYSSISARISISLAGNNIMPSRPSARENQRQPSRLFSQLPPSSGLLHSR